MRDVQPQSVVRELNTACQCGHTGNAVYMFCWYEQAVAVLTIHSSDCVCTKTLLRGVVVILELSAHGDLQTKLSVSETHRRLDNISTQ